MGNQSPNPELDQAFADAAAAVDEAQAHEDGGDTAREEHAPASEHVAEALVDAKRELETALEQTRKEAAQLRDRWMRAAADLENHRRRAAREREDVKKFGIEGLLKDLLPVIDDVSRAVQVTEEQLGGGSSGSNDPTEQLLGGVRLVQKKFMAALEKHGVTTFESTGTTFNPERHEAVQQAHSDLPAGSVASELQRGFLIHDRLLRPALVVVSLGPEGGEPAGKGSE